MKITPENITSLRENEIFTFGSNSAGRHGAGAALTARKLFGAMPGIGQGRTGQCYAIATKDHDMQVISTHEIGMGVKQFLTYAKDHPHLEFLVTPIGCGLAGYKPEDIAPLFFCGKSVPENMSLPSSFWAWNEHQKP